MGFLLNTDATNPMIFVILAIGAVMLLVLYIRSKKASGTQENEQNASETENNVISEATESANEEIIAVIAAAIAMAESENNGLKFRVVSFRRI
jgi:Na+-transporting methylmalonyl-CoA/oxaloacetate decarboxylase gamma subunit